jgi:NitT/TauT family transport system permease protein
LGLGHLLMMGRDLNDMSQVIAVMILIMLLGYAVDLFVFQTIERRMKRRWGLSRG